MLASHSFTYQQLTEKTETHMREYLAFAGATDDVAERARLYASVRSLFALWTGMTNALARQLEGDAKRTFDADQRRLLVLATAGQQVCA